LVLFGAGALVPPGTELGSTVGVSVKAGGSLGAVDEASISDSGTWVGKSVDVGSLDPHPVLKTKANKTKKVFTEIDFNPKRILRVFRKDYRSKWRNSKETCHLCLSTIGVLRHGNDLQEIGKTRKLKSHTKEYLDPK
jgi:hypothetical protein